MTRRAAGRSRRGADRCPRSCLAAEQRAEVAPPALDGGLLAQDLAVEAGPLPRVGDDLAAAAGLHADGRQVQASRDGTASGRDQDLSAGRIGKNQKYGANFFYRLAPNVLASFEASQLRTTYIAVGDRLFNHYDLSFAYQF